MATTLLIGQNRWGVGQSKEEAKKNFQGQGGKLSRGYTLVEFDEATRFNGVDTMGYVSWSGNEPTVTEVPAR